MYMYYVRKKQRLGIGLYIIGVVHHVKVIRVYIPLLGEPATRIC